MKNIIIKLRDESDLYEKYSNEVSSDLINYLIREIKYTKEDIKITIHTGLKIENIDNIIKDGLLKRYNKLGIIYNFYDYKQIIFFIIGVVFLIISTFINQEVIKEIVVIAGWVGIWEMIGITLNTDSDIKLNKRKIKKLLDCKIEIINNKI